MQKIKTKLRDGGWAYFYLIRRVGQNQISRSKFKINICPTFCVRGNNHWNIPKDIKCDSMGRSLSENLHQNGKRDRKFEIVTCKTCRLKTENNA